MLYNLNMEFDNRQTNISKGIATILLLWHHLFLPPELNSAYTSLFFVNGIQMEGAFAELSKVCVAIFLILSGYGMNKSYKKHREKSTKKPIAFDLAFLKRSLLRLYAPFWIVFLIFVPMGFLFNRNPVLIYESNVLNLIFDSLGLSYLVHGFFYFTMNNTWWYMSIIIVLYLMYPLLHRAIARFPELTFCVVFAVSFIPLPLRDYSIWLLPFVLGMFASEKRLFERMAAVKANKAIHVFLSLMSLILLGIFRYFVLCNTVYFDFAFGFCILILIFLGISRIPVLDLVMENLGKRSAVIYMMHSFICYYYFSGFIYSFKYPPLIFLSVLLISFAAAVLIQKIMDITKYNEMIKSASKL